MTGFAPPTLLAQAARLQARQRFFNLIVTNVPGPQFPLYLLGRRLLAFYPQVPLAQNTALGIAIMTYDGRSSSACSATTTRWPTSTTSPPTCARRSRAGRGRRRAAPRKRRRPGRRAARPRARLEAGCAAIGPGGGPAGLVLLPPGGVDAEIGSRPRRGPGELRPDRGAAHGAGRRAPAAPGPPTSGAHRADLVDPRAARLTDDQLLHALERATSSSSTTRRDRRAALAALQREVAGPFDAELAAAGQAVSSRRRAGAGAATALAWRRMLQLRRPDDPRLRDFVEAWLAPAAVR